MLRPLLKLRPAKTEEVTPEAQVGLLSSFLNIGKRSLSDALIFKPHRRLSLEIGSFEQKTSFYLSPPPELSGYFNSQLLSQYPKTLVETIKEDPLEKILGQYPTATGFLNLAHSFVFPLKSFREPQELPPLSAVLGFFAKIGEEEAAWYQLVLTVSNQDKIQRQIRNNLKTTNDEGQEVGSEYQGIIQKKLNTPLVKAQIRLVFGAKSLSHARERLAEMGGSFGIYTLSEANSLTFKTTGKLQAKGFNEALVNRSLYRWQPTLNLNLDETASLWHLPDKALEKIKLVDWGKTLLSEAPDNLPVAEIYTDDQEKRQVNFFAQTDWRNHQAIFGLKREDRRKHVYIIGKTGSGKTTLIANKAINDIRNGEGVAVIDPHGDMCQMIMDYIPKRRVNDVIYLDPTLSADQAFSLNLFDDQGAAHTDVVASGIVSVFYKLYHHSWGPRLEYILRNSILSLLYYGEATFADIPLLLTNRDFRAKVVNSLESKDPVLTHFWRDEFEQMNDRLRVEAISPILNKVGQFLSSQRIRQIVGVKRSTFSLEEVMNHKKILLINLSQGKLGEDTTALLGAMFITKMQLTAMGRVGVSQEDRPDFYLYVDEFQNFATHSFIKILSEARKYRLNLILANQYIGQVDEDIQKAIFGNVGTLISFVVGAADSSHLEREFGGIFTSEDLVALGKYEILLKMTIDELTADPFLAKTLPLPSVRNDNREKILKLNLEKYYKKVG